MTSPEVEDIKRYMEEVVGRIVAEVDAIMEPMKADIERWRAKQAGRGGEGEEPKREE